MTTMTAGRSTGYLTQSELAQALDAKESWIAQLTRDGTIPARFFHRDGGAYAYAQVTLAVCGLALELQTILGSNSKLVKPLVARVTSQIESAWHSGTSAPSRLVVQYGDGITLMIALSFLARARAQVEELTA